MLLLLPNLLRLHFSFAVLSHNFGQDDLLLTQSARVCGLSVERLPCFQFELEFHAMMRRKSTGRKKTARHMAIA